MAIFTDLPGYEATVVVNGVVCEEHSPPEDNHEREPRAIVRYIQATTGAKFAVHIHIRQEALALLNNDMCACVKVDGQVISKRLWRKQHGHHEPKIVDGLEVKAENTWRKRELVFSKINTDDTLGRKVDAALKEQIDKLGQITIDFYRANISQRTPSLPLCGNASMWSEGVDTVPEKALKGKALSQKASLSDATKPIAPPKLCKVNYVDQYGSPFATISFCYRSRNDLQAELIIARSPSPIPLEERPAESLTLEESRELIRRLQDQASHLKQDRIRMKRERDSSPATVHKDDDDISIVEPEPKRRRQAKIIDLTDD